MSSNNLENEDLDIVPLVRMEDVQPSRERPADSRSLLEDDVQVYETCIIDDIEYVNECVVDDDGDEDSNIGSMVSLPSEDVFDEGSNQELIIPESLEEVSDVVIKSEDEELEIYIDSKVPGSLTKEYLLDPIDEKKSIIESKPNNKKFEKTKAKTVHHNKLILSNPVSKREANEIVIRKSTETSNLKPIEIEVPACKKKKVDEPIMTPSESWPTLEILPGGVIKNIDKYENEAALNPEKVPETVANAGEMMYACAKCSQKFKYLFCLVKHVKWHEDEKKSVKDSRGSRMRVPSNKYICLHSGKECIVVPEKNKRKTPKRLKS